MKDEVAFSAARVGDVVKSYGNKRVVNDVSFSVAQGEIFGLIGPNGAGKTTIIRMMMDIIKPDSGDIHIPKITFTEPLAEECAHFVECIRERSTPRTDGRQGLAVVAALEAAQASIAADGAGVDVQTYD